MDVKRAREILDKTDYCDIKEGQHELIDGIAILGKYNDRQNKYDFQAEHEQIWFMDFESSVEKMTEDDFNALVSLNWFESEDAWSLFV